MAWLEVVLWMLILALQLVEIQAPYVYARGDPAVAAVATWIFLLEAVPAKAVPCALLRAHLLAPLGEQLRLAVVLVWYPVAMWSCSLDLAVKRDLLVRSLCRRVHRFEVNPVR